MYHLRCRWALDCDWWAGVIMTNDRSYRDSATWKLIAKVLYASSPSSIFYFPPLVRLKCQQRCPLLATVTMVSINPPLLIIWFIQFFFLFIILFFFSLLSPSYFCWCYFVVVLALMLAWASASAWALALTLANSRLFININANDLPSKLLSSGIQRMSK